MTADAAKGAARALRAALAEEARLAYRLSQSVEQHRWLAANGYLGDEQDMAGRAVKQQTRNNLREVHRQIVRMLRDHRVVELLEGR